MVPHPYCIECGLVKFVGSSRAVDLGALLNLIGKFERLLKETGRRLTEVQRRLIIQKLQALEAGDAFGLSRDAQFRLVAEIVGGHLGIPAGVAESYLRSC